MNKYIKKFNNIWFLTFFYLGFLPKAPGTFGSVGGVIFSILILECFSNETLFLATLLISVLGVREIDKYEKKTGIHDDKKIVIDEVAGVMLTFIITGYNYYFIVLNFIFFRIFDITKPSFIGRIDRAHKGGLSVMGDDLLAGIVAGICSSGVYQFLVKFNLLF